MSGLLKGDSKKIITVTFFSAAMGYLEAAVVIYMRLLYYPNGFNFPLVTIPEPVINIELLREAATIIMLGTVSIIAGKNNLQRFLFFLYTFAIWDITYYLWLKTLIGWPESFLTWDLLFLIPLPWTSPVLAPVICSITMIFLSLSLIRLQCKGHIFNINKTEWFLFISGSLIILFSFTSDYINLAYHFLNNEGYNKEPVKGQLFQIIEQYVPTDFKWLIFITGEILILTAIFMIILRVKKSKKSVSNSSLLF